MAGLNISYLADDPVDAVERALRHSTYLSSLDRRLGLLDILRGGESAEDMLLSALAHMSDLSLSSDTSDTMVEMRHAKAKAHFALAALDLAGHYSVHQVTGALTDLADRAVATAMQVTANSSDLSLDGIAMFALGKMGAGELNYSSDIDMAAFYDPDRFAAGHRDPAEAAARLVRDAMRMLEARTAEGYVFRTDLRLRPDPSSNPIAVPLNRAAIYYESVGQNWERMVWIKGRAIAGDPQTSEWFQTMIEPFVWRRHLDYWAIADVRAIKTMINAKMKDLDEETPGCDVKLGPGGIREIEFFVQTQQIILGGRNPALRVRPTLEALDGLTELGAVDSVVAAELSDAYEQLRAVEHRIQMRLDEQSHTLPASDEARSAVASLCGYDDLSLFDPAVFETRSRVNRHYAELFSDQEKPEHKSVRGNLVFTGVDDDPETVKTLTTLGFQSPSDVIGSIRQWHRARTPATRSPRGRELLTALLPDLLGLMAKTGEPDQAFRQFARFFEGLRSGVQTLSMLEAEPVLLEDLVNTLALAPGIADTLARRPSLLETLLSVGDRKPRFELDEMDNFESAIDKARAWHGEQSFLIGHQLLHGRLTAAEAALAWTDLADHIISKMSAAALKETERRFGASPGAWAVMALGKLGGSEMTAGSDLDLLVIFDPHPDVDAQAWFTRFTQRLIAALSAETGQGQLYEVDMRLRPSGRAGPVATSIAAFERYHTQDAWTWEHMALTRLRFLSGDTSLGDRANKIARQIITAASDPDQVRADILDMRQRLARDKPANGAWDLKMREGGLVDLEFIVQQSILLSGSPDTVHPALRDAIPALVSLGQLSEEEGALLLDAFQLYQLLQQVQRVTLNSDGTSKDMSMGLKDRLCRAVDISPFDALAARLEAMASDVTALRCKKIGPLATES